MTGPTTLSSPRPDSEERPPTLEEQLEKALADNPRLRGWLRKNAESLEKLREADEAIPDRRRPAVYGSTRYK